MIPHSQPAATTEKLPVLKNGELECEHCGALERSGMDVCERTDCPYIRRVTSPRGVPWIAYSIIFALVLVGIGLLCLISTSGEAIIIGGIFFVVAAVIAIGGTRESFEYWMLLYNPQHGAVLRRKLRHGKEVRRLVILPVERLHFPPSPFAEQNFPMSAAILHRPLTSRSRQERRTTVLDTLVAQVYIATIADLASRGYLAVYKASSTGTYKDDYLVVGGRETAQNPIQGALERRILKIVSEWTETLLRFPKYTSVESAPNAVSVVYLTLRKAEYKPADEVLKIIEPDVSALSADPLRSADAYHDEAMRWFNLIEREHPDFVRVLEKQIAQALSDRTASGD